MGEEGAIKQEGKKPSYHAGGFQRKGTQMSHQHSSWNKGSPFKSSIAKLEDATFTCGHPGDAAKFDRTIKKFKNYVVRNYDGGLNLAKGILDGKLPSIELHPQPVKVEVEKR